MSISWLLFKKSGRQSIGRLSLTAAAVALGLFVLLALTAGTNGLMGRAQHVDWRFAVFNAKQNNQKPIPGVSPLKASLYMPGNLNKWHDKEFDVMSVYAAGDHALKLPGGIKTPAPGEYYLSEALAKIAKERPEDRIGERYGTKYLGTIPASLESSPDSLSVIRGANVDEAAAKDDYGQSMFVDMYKFDTSGMRAGFGAVGLALIAVGGTVLLFPIVMFVAVATQLGSAQREQRYAAIRLIGGTRRQVTKILLFESFIATLAGVVVGSLAYLATLPLLQQYKFDDMRFMSQDMVVGWGQYALIVGLTLVLSLAANWWGMRHVQTSPLGVARKQKVAKKPRLWRVIPLLAGLGIFVWMTLPEGVKWVKSADDAMMPMLALMGGIVLVMFGLVLAGSWLTYILSRVAARFTARPSTLIAGKRISGQSKQVFRSVSGVVLALFAGSFYLTAVGGVDKLNADAVNDNGYSQLKKDTALVMVEPAGNDLAETLRSQSYVRSVEKVYRKDDNSYIPCQALPVYTRHICPDNKEYAVVNFNNKVVKTVATVDAVDKGATLPTYMVALNSNDNIDALRTLIAENSSQTANRYVISGTYAQQPHISPVVKSFAEMAYVGIGLTMSVAVCSMIVSTIGGLLERRRSLLTLRLGGMTIGQLKQIVMIESLIPLVSVSLVAAGLGVWVSTIFLSSLSNTVKPTLTLTYYCIVGGLLAAAAVGVYLVLPMIKKITSLEENRTE